MKTTDATYRALRSLEGSWYETQVVRGPVVYGDNVLTPYEKKIEKLSINPALFDDGGPQIGIARACVCRLEVYEAKENWPRMASFSVRMRIHSADGTQVSGWVPMGVFFTDRRKPDVFGKLSVTAYDGMLLLEQSWTDRIADPPAQWPITALSAAALLEEATGIQCENKALLDDTVAFVGLDTQSTAREVWSDIAAAHGCNLQMTAAGKLRLVPFASLGTYTGAVADIAIADYAVVNSTGADPQPGDFFPLGLAVSTLDTGDDLPAVTGVELRAEDGAVATAGTGSGYVLKGVCNFSDSAAAQLCLSRTAGCFYRPFDADTAHIDPAADPGDLVCVGGRVYQLMALDWTLCAMPTADIGAPFEEEVDHEYAVQSEGGRAYRKAMAQTAKTLEAYPTAVQMNSAISQTAASITQSVAAAYVSNDALLVELADYSPTAQIQQNYYNKAAVDAAVGALASEVALTESSLTVAFSQLQADTNDAVNAMSYYIRYENGVVIIGRTDAPASIRISNSQIALYYGNEVVSYWNQEKQYTPKALQIPTGGSFTLGSVLFQPRSSGNLSLMWTGS